VKPLGGDEIGGPGACRKKKKPLLNERPYVEAGFIRAFFADDDEMGKKETGEPPASALSRRRNVSRRVPVLSYRGRVESCGAHI